MKTVMEFSAGGVIYKKEKEDLKVCLILTHDGTVWQLPKGHIDKGEPVEEAAAREVKEETGLEGEVEQRIDKISYWFVEKHRNPPERVHKTVYFCLMKYLSGDPQDHDREVDEARWFDINEALKKLSYKNEKEVLQKAVGLIA